MLAITVAADSNGLQVSLLFLTRQPAHAKLLHLLLQQLKGAPVTAFAEFAERTGELGVDLIFGKGLLH